MALRQQVRFCTAPDGTRIALASAGSGPPLLRASHWLSHVEHDVESPVWAPWVAALAKDHTYHRYDQRGCGLSDRSFAGLSLDAWVSDLEAVVEHLGLARFPLIGMSQGGAVAVAYARRHPGRVSRLVLIGAYAQGVLRREVSDAVRLEAATLVNMIRIGWGSDNDAFRQVFTNQFIPGGTPEQLRWWTELQRSSASAEVAARTLEAFYDVDVVADAAALDLPTLVVHSTGDLRVPFDEGRRLAALIPGARFVALQSNNHVLLEGEPAWAPFLDALKGFLAEDTASQPPAASLTAAESAVLELLAQGLGNQAIADRLGKTEKTVRNQLSVIFAKLGVGTRAEAIVQALKFQRRQD
jgi:pimeloyl-ACP methyl ester carboxylesterase/DNA-binding CsgD family transcriptional regulator